MSEFPGFIMFIDHIYFLYHLYHFLGAQQCAQAAKNTGFKKDLGSIPAPALRRWVTLHKVPSLQASVSHA